MVPRIHVAVLARPPPPAVSSMRSFSALARAASRPCPHRGRQSQQLFVPPIAAVRASPSSSSFPSSSPLLAAQKRFHNNYSPLPPGGLPPQGGGSGLPPGYIPPLPQQQQQQQQPLGPPQPDAKTRKRKLWRRLSAVAFLLMGISAAGQMQKTYQKMLPPLYELGSGEEEQLKATMAREIDSTPMVQELLASPDWVEWQREDSASSRSSLDSSTDASLGSAAAPRKRLTTGALGGLNGMNGYHRVFRNTTTGEIMSIIWLGPALAGWPATAHGGALATILDEALGRCAIFSLPARTGVTARLELSYRRPVKLPGLYTVLCTPEAPPSDITQDRRKLWCTAKLTGSDSANVCVEARALFVVPKGYKLGRVEDRF